MIKTSGIQYLLITMDKNLIHNESYFTQVVMFGVGVLCSLCPTVCVLNSSFTLSIKSLFFVLLLLEKKATLLKAWDLRVSTNIYFSSPQYLTVACAMCLKWQTSLWGWDTPLSNNFDFLGNGLYLPRYALWPFPPLRLLGTSIWSDQVFNGPFHLRSKNFENFHMIKSQFS